MNRTAELAAPGLTNATFAEIADVLRNHESFAVLSHVRPDGDALGSQLAMGLSLQQLGKRVKVWNEEGREPQRQRDGRRTQEQWLHCDKRLGATAPSFFGDSRA